MNDSSSDRSIIRKAFGAYGNLALRQAGPIAQFPLEFPIYLSRHCVSPASSLEWLHTLEQVEVKPFFSTPASMQWPTTARFHFGRFLTL
jgi:hypothetical protein